MTPDLHDKALDHIRRVALESIESVLNTHNLDVIVANSDSQLISFAAMLGWPIGTFPVNKLRKNGQRWGTFVMGRKEEDILRLMGDWDRVRGEQDMAVWHDSGPSWMI
jgi:hypothetical protein